MLFVTGPAAAGFFKHEVSGQDVGLIVGGRRLQAVDLMRQISRPWDQSQLARLQNDALLAMKQQCATELHQADLVQDMSLREHPLRISSHGELFGANLH